MFNNKIKKKQIGTLGIEDVDCESKTILTEPKFKKRKNLGDNTTV